MTSYSPTGVLQWDTPYQVGSGNHGRRIIVTSDGSIVQAGFTAGETSTGVVARLSGAGAIAWTTQVGVSGRNELVDVAELPDGSFVAVGRTTGSIDGGPPAGGDSDAVITRVSATGALLWAEQFGTAGTDAFTAVDVSPAGEILVAGTSNGAFLGGTQLGGSDAVLVEVNDTGAVQWHRQFGTIGQDEAGDVLALGGNEVIAAGYSNSAFPKSGSGGVFIARLGSTDIAWTRQWAGSAADTGAVLVQTSSGSVWVGGQTGSSSSASALLVEVSSDGTYLRHGTISGTMGATGLAIDSAGFLWTGTALGGVVQGFDEAPNPVQAGIDGARPTHRREPVTLTATEHTDLGVVVRYDWDLNGDGHYEAPGAATQTVSWDDTGRKTVGVRVTTSLGNTAVAQASIEVLPDPVPVVSLVLPEQALTGMPVTAAATAAVSFGSVAGFAFDLDGDGLFEHESLDRSVPVSWASAGSHVVRVRVTSDRGVTAEAEARTEVYSSPPGGETGVSINAGAAYTNDKNVDLHVSWPAYANEVRISNDGGFALVLTSAVRTPIAWTLDDSVEGRNTKVVYVRFTGPGADSRVTYSDDIILDTEAPTVSRVAARLLGAGNGVGVLDRRLRRGGVRIELRARASDKLTGVEAVTVSTKRSGGAARTLPYAGRLRVRLPIKAVPERVLVRVQDGAGNWSKWRTAKVAS